MSFKMKPPRTEINYCVCCDCLPCRNYTGHGFMVLETCATKPKAMKALERYSPNHLEHCFLAKEITQEIIAKPSKRKVA